MNPDMVARGARVFQTLAELRSYASVIEKPEKKSTWKVTKNEVSEIGTNAVKLRLTASIKVWRQWHNKQLKSTNYRSKRVD